MPAAPAALPAKEADGDRDQRVDAGRQVQRQPRQKDERQREKPVPPQDQVAQAALLGRGAFLQPAHEFGGGRELRQPGIVRPTAACRHGADLGRAFPSRPHGRSRGKQLRAHRLHRRTGDIRYHLEREGHGGRGKARLIVAGLRGEGAIQRQHALREARGRCCRRQHHHFTLIDRYRLGREGEGALAGRGILYRAHFDSWGRRDLHLRGDEVRVARLMRVHVQPRREMQDDGDLEGIPRADAIHRGHALNLQLRPSEALSADGRARR